MVEIISKQSGPDRRDQEMKRVLGENRQTINRLADHLSQGAWSARRAQVLQPAPERASRVGYTPDAEEDRIEPGVRISPNDRVVLVNAVTSRQIAFLGMIRGARQDRRFVLATRDNGFFDPVAQDIALMLVDLDGARLQGPDAEDELARVITTKLGLAIVDEGPDG